MYMYKSGLIIQYDPAAYNCKHLAFETRKYKSLTIIIRTLSNFNLFGYYLFSSRQPN